MPHSAVAALVVLGAGLLCVGALGLDATSQETTPIPSVARDTVAVDAVSISAGNPSGFRWPAAFVPNRGQWPEGVRYTLAGERWAAFLAKDGWTYASETGSPGTDTVESTVRGAAIRMRFVNCARKVDLIPEGRLPGITSYFLGPNAQAWRSGLPRYASVRLRSLYPGVDIRVRQTRGRLEYDLLLSPGARLDEVVCEVEGADGLEIDAEGSLILRTAPGPIVQPPPISWEVKADGTKQRVTCQYVLLGEKRFGFTCPAWSGRTRLVVDPLLWATYLGGNGQDSPSFGSVAVQSDGTVTVAGFTDAVDYPVTPGVYQRIKSIARDGFVARLDPRKTGPAQLLWATYLGGSQNDHVEGLHVDDQGIVTVSGDTPSTDFPVVNPYQATAPGNVSIFLSRLSADGTTLLWSTYLGGSWGDRPNAGLAVDARGVITLSGTASSRDFPLVNPYAGRNSNIHEDMFLARMDPGKTGKAQLIWSTHIGGSSYDSSLFISQDSTGVVTAAGQAQSVDFPLLRPYQSTHGGGIKDTVVFQLDPSRSGSAQLLWATYLGGGGLEAVADVEVDGQGRVVVSGNTQSSNFPTSTGALRKTLGGTADGYVAVLDPSTSGNVQLFWSSYLGGSADDTVYDVIPDSSGGLTAVGATSSSDFPVSPAAYQTTRQGSHDGFLVQLDPRLAGQSSLLWSTFLGGALSDGAVAVAEGADGFFTVAGSTQSTDFPVTAGAYQSSPGGGNGDTFLARLAPREAVIHSLSVPRIHTVATLHLHAWQGAGLTYFAAASFLNTGIPVGNRMIPLGYDLLFAISLFAPEPIFNDFRGILDKQGQAAATVDIPDIPALVGHTVYCAFVTLDATAPLGVRHISNGFPLRVEP